MNWQHPFTFSSLASAGSTSPLALLPELEESPSASHQMTVLIVEDDDIQRSLLVSQLKSVGLNTIPVDCIAGAKQALADSHVDMAIVDVDLPDGNGLEFCESTVDDPHTANLPILVLSSLTDPFLVRRTRAAGGHFFIGKPYDPNVLLAMIERMLDISL